MYLIYELIMETNLFKLIVTPYFLGFKILFLSIFEF